MREREKDRVGGKGRQTSNDPSFRPATASVKYGAKASYFILGPGVVSQGQTSWASGPMRQRLHVCSHNHSIHTNTHQE